MSWWRARDAKCLGKATLSHTLSLSLPLSLTHTHCTFLSHSFVFFLVVSTNKCYGHCCAHCWLQFILINVSLWMNIDQLTNRSCIWKCYCCRLYVLFFSHTVLEWLGQLFHSFKISHRPIFLFSHGLLSMKCYI